MLGIALRHARLYIAMKGHAESHVSVAVVIQTMVQASSRSCVYGAPSDRDKNHMIIEVLVGQLLVGGSVTRLVYSR